MLWVATVLVAAFAFFPNYVGALVGGRQPESVEGTAVYLEIQGMTCETCALPIEKELRAVPGVRSAQVSFGERRATITADPASPPAEAELLQAVQRAGYEATVTDGSRDATTIPR